MNNALQVEGLKKRFGTKEVLKGVSFSVPENSVFGFIGQNGAGKTTTMKTILGLLQQDEGVITVFGEKVTYGNTKTNRMVGYLPDVPEFYDYMTTREYLRLCAEIAGVPAGERKQRIEEMLKMVGLADEKHRIKGFSRGMKQRLGIAQALLHKPKLLICDEPTSALDPTGRKEILDALQAAKVQTTVLFSTHILSDVERICDRAAILHNGEIVLSGTMEELHARKNGNDFLVAASGREETEALRAHFPKFEEEVISGQENVLRWRKGSREDFRRVLAYVAEKDIAIRSAEWAEATLEDLFLSVTKETASVKETEVSNA
ncbi:MAG: ABC transporter ATP-binding protein [Lachnospiraceae bacterium]|nr:ABC transporter ATP-binding protein [Lachnospiraceae bacterium]